MQLLIQAPAPNYKSSIDFYARINFTTIYSDEDRSIVSDGKVNILVNGSRDARLGFVAYVDDYDVVIQRYRDSYAIFPSDDGQLTADPNGVRLYLKSMESMPEINSEANQSLLGNNHGFGIETLYMEKSLEFWRRLGYGVPESEERSYVTLTSPFMPELTLYSPGMCPHAFYNPSLTYFNGKEGNSVVINNLKEANVNPTEEITIFNPENLVDNIIIGDPGGLHFFIFND